MRNRANHAKNSMSFLLSIIGALALGTAQVCAQGIITTVAGNGLRGFSGDGGPAASASLNVTAFTGGVAADAAGNVYIADTGNHRVRKIDPGGIISTVAGNGAAKFSGDGGPATSAALNNPSGLATDSAGNLYIVDGGNQRVRKVSRNGIISTVSGNGNAGFSGDGGPATSASLHFNRYTGDCAVDTVGNLYLPDTENYGIRKVGTDGIINTIASVRWPYSVAVDARDAVYVGGEDGVYKVIPGGTSLVAMGLNSPAGVVVDRVGNTYIADSHSHRIRKVEPNGVVTVFAGSGDPIFDPIEGYYFVGGFSGDGGPATSARLNFPWGVAVDAAGNLYIADSGNNSIRKVTAAPNDNQSTFSNPSSFLLYGPLKSETSAITVSDLAGKVSKVTATINFGDHGAPPANLAFWLVGPNGQSSILMSGVLVNKPFQLTLTFDDAASSSLTNNPASGTYKPGETLSIFNGTSPNGDWKLYAVNSVDNPGCSILGEGCTVVGGWSLTITTAPALPNQIDDAQFFVRRQYLDFLNREADPDGLNFWTGEIFMCGSDPQCIEVKRINDSASFFLSIEFQETGYLVYRFYKASYGNLPNAPVPIKLDEFLPDSQAIGKNVVVKQAGWEQTLENNKQLFAAAFVQRQRFVSAYPTTLSPETFVDSLFTNAGVTPSSADRSAAVAEFGAATNTADVTARARTLRRIAENSTLAQQEFNRAFVLMQYFGYLRRNPNEPPEATLDYQGYNFWLDKLNTFNGNFVQAEMVKAFISSTEYRLRFGP